MRQNRRIVVVVIVGLFVLYLVLNKNKFAAFSIKKPYVISSECHVTSLRTHSIESQNSHEQCVIHKPSLAACWEANKYFGNPSDDLGTRRCNNNSTSDICWFTDTFPPKLQCSVRFCEDSNVYMARIDSRYGVVRNWQQINPFTTENVQKFVMETKAEGGTFCFIKCAGFIRLILFPPKVLLKENSDRKPNVVIILLDSLSRRHFYRVMRKSVQAFKDVMNNMATNVLDFELTQSISMHTFDNLRPLFSGVTHGDTNFKKKTGAQRPLGIDVLFNHYKNHGYQTMIQEDLCWHDEWGSMLDHLEQKPDSNPSPQRWARFNEVISKHQLDHVGITHITCQILKAYDLTTLYDRPPKVCFNGRFISTYFYKYIRSYVNAIRRTPNAAPIILYQHFNTAHTPTGTRIMNMDEELASFIHFMARDPNTWTIILSDHGHTRTSYGQTEDGLLERYNPLLFMIIPELLAKRLGKQTMDNLSTNQRRLLTTLDINKALMTLNQDSNTRSSNFRISGVFSKIPSNRTCSDLPLMPLARCQCDGAEESLKDNSQSHTWLAEFALGTLNDLIQYQYSKGEHSKSRGVKGYGRCVRMRGKGFTKVIQSQHGSQVTFNIHVDATRVGLQDDEVFLVAVKLTNGIPSLALYDRQTLYNKFKKCSDESVELKLCMCSKQTSLNDNHISTESVVNIKEYSMFHSQANITKLYEDCLLQITRRHPSGLSVAYEVVNSCNDKTFQVDVKGSTYYVFLSKQLPMKFTVEPNTIRFMFSGARQILNHSHLDIVITATVLK